MATAKQTIEAAVLGQGCLGKAADDEPVFVLRAQDAEAADLVELWAIRAGLSGKCNSDKIREAHGIVDEMRKWPIRKPPD